MGKCFAKLGNSFGLPPNASSPGKDASLAKAGQCASECLLNEWKVLKKGVIDVKTAIANVKKMLAKDTVWFPVFSEGIRTCAQKANNNQKKFAAALNGATVDGTTVCRLNFYFLFTTIKKITFK